MKMFASLFEIHRSHLYVIGLTLYCINNDTCKCKKFSSVIIVSVYYWHENAASQWHRSNDAKVTCIFIRNGMSFLTNTHSFFPVVHNDELDFPYVIVLTLKRVVVASLFCYKPVKINSVWTLETKQVTSI